MDNKVTNCKDCIYFGRCAMSGRNYMYLGCNVGLHFQDVVTKDSIIRQINMLNPSDHEQAIVGRIIEMIREM